MMTWTESAQKLLERYLAYHHRQAETNGADASEVEADMRRLAHSAPELVGVSVVSEDLLRTALLRLGPAEWESQVGMITPPGGAFKQGCFAFFFVCTGILMPIIVLFIELSTRACASELFNPLPHWWSVILVALVPLANFLAVLNLPASYWRMLLHCLAMGVAIFYGLIFLPLAPYSLFGIIFLGFGLIPLTPVLAMISTIICGFHLWRKRPAFACSKIPFLIAVIVPILVCIFPAWRVQRTKSLAAEALNEQDPQSAKRALSRLRSFGDLSVIHRAAYGRNTEVYGVFNNFGSRRNQSFIPPDAARRLYYQLTGMAYNLRAPDISTQFAANERLFDEFDWDEDLGGNSVAGQVRGLSLAQSRLDGRANGDEAWGYWEWTLEFQNDHQMPREARALIQLPPGGVVSRVTLWIDGEEREAAFGGRSQVRAAYQEVAVRQRRDPVLVTTTSRDQILVQCFPVPPRGKMKTRLGITAPLLLASESEARMHLPKIVERNFKFVDSLQHSVWLDSPNELSHRSLIKHRKDQTTWAVHGDLSQHALVMFGEPAVKIARDPKRVVAWVPMDREGQSAFIKQEIASSLPAAPGRVAMVFDSSASISPIEEDLRWLRRAFTGEIKAWQANDGAVPVQDLGQVSIVPGGHDNVPALIAAWDWATEKPNGVVIWFHGSQPVLFPTAAGLVQRLERSGGSPGGGVLWDAKGGYLPNRLADELGYHPSYHLLLRYGTLREDLCRALGIGESPAACWDIRRSLLSSPDEAMSRLSQGSPHIARLWGAEEVYRLHGLRKDQEAMKLAVSRQLVTPVSGAVVLGTKAQYARHDLEPANPNSVPMVPEPSSTLLAALGFAWLILRRVRPNQ